jgi:hypothetical protein
MNTEAKISMQIQKANDNPMLDYDDVVNLAIRNRDVSFTIEMSASEWSAMIANANNKGHKIHSCMVSLVDDQPQYA